MAGSFRIQGDDSREIATVQSHEGQPRGLMTYTHPYSHWTYDVRFLTNPTYGRDVNQDPTAVSVTSTNIHDGLDNAGWTGTNISGTGFVFNSTAQAFSGTASIDGTGSSNNNIASFAAPSPLNTATVSFIRARVYITGWDNRGTKQVLFFFANNAAVVGATIDLADYVDVTLLNTWQLADIPMSDFQITASEVDELRVETIDQGPGAPPNYYLDEIQYVSSSSSVDVFEYTYFPAYDDEYYISAVRFTALTSGKTDIDSSEFFGITALTNGIELVLRDRTTIYAALDARDTFGLLSWGDVNLQSTGSNNNVTTIVDFRIPPDQLRLIGKKGMYIVLRVRDNLSTIAKLNVSVTLARVTQ
jgi:hypothetical protein